MKATELKTGIISWVAPAAKGNQPYGGVARIIKIDADKRTPITAETIAGDDLSFAFIDITGDIAYGDGGRNIARI